MKRAMVLLLLAGCGHVPGADVNGSGTLNLRLKSSGKSDGAITVIVFGGPVTSVQVPSGYQVVSSTDSYGAHLMVIGNITVGSLASIEVPDITLANNYYAAVVQVADRTTFSLLDPGNDEPVLSFSQ